MTFENFRAQFIVDCKNASACEPEFKRLLNSETKQQVIEVIKDNIAWCFNNGVLTTEKLLDSFSVEELNSFDIYTSGEHSIVTRNSDIKKIITLGSSQATVETLGISQATVKTLGSSQATVKTWDSSQATFDYSNGGLIQDRSAKKIYIKKSDYEIVLID